MSATTILRTIRISRFTLLIRMLSLAELLFRFRLNLYKNVKMHGGLNMAKLLLRTVILTGVLIVLGIFKPNPVQAQCFHLGQAFECNGLPDGTSSLSFNPDGTINLSNGQIVPGDFFNTPFRVPGLDTTPTLIIPVTPDRPPITFFPTTADGINALTAFSHALDREEEYQQASLIFNKRLANRWLLRGFVYWQYWQGDRGVPYDPEAARQLLEEAGWVETPSGERKYVKLEL